jgi:hypothetical protein
MIKFKFQIYKNQRKKDKYLSFPWLPIILLIFSITTTSCFSVKYSMSGASISPEVKTISIQYFQDRSNSGQPAFSQQFTTALRDKCKSQTSLVIVTDGGDVAFEGEIAGFDAQPTAIQGNDLAAKERLTVTIHVKFTNTVDPKLNFDTNFSRFEEYDAKLMLSAVSNELFPKIIDELTEDIFNKAFANW